MSTVCVPWLGCRKRDSDDENDVYNRVWATHGPGYVTRAISTVAFSQKSVSKIKKPILNLALELTTWVNTLFVTRFIFFEHG